MANENIRKEYNGASIQTTLAVDISAAATSITLTSGSSYPTGATGPFVISIGRGGAGLEEHILCSSRSGNVLTVLNRGYDNTTAVTHTAGATVYHIWDAASANQVNLMANIGTTAGDTIYFTAAGVVTRRAIGTAGYPLVVSGGVPTWARLTNTGVDPAAAIAPTKMGITPRAWAYQTAAQSVAHNTNTALTMGVELYDTDSIHSIVTNTNRMTIPAGYAGLWMFGYSMLFAGAASGFTGAAWLEVNGAGAAVTRYGFTQGLTGNSIAFILSSATQIDLIVGDYVNLVAST